MAVGAAREEAPGISASHRAKGPILMILTRSSRDDWLLTPRRGLPSTIGSRLGASRGKLYVREEAEVELLRLLVFVWRFSPVTP